MAGAPSQRSDVDERYAEESKKVRLLVQRLDALRPYHAHSVPQSVVEKMTQLDKIDTEVDTHFTVLRGETEEHQHNLTDLLEPLLHRIRAAVEHSNTADVYADNLHSGSGSDGLMSSDSCWTAELSRRIAHGREEDAAVIHVALDGLCNSTAKREKMRKALLRFAFSRLRSHGACIESLSLVGLGVRPGQANEPPQTAPARLGEQKDLVGFVPVRIGTEAIELYAGLPK